MLNNLLKQVLYYGKNGLAAVGGAEIVCYTLCGALVFCFLCGAVVIRWARRTASPDELTEAMQKNALLLRVFRLQAKLLFLLLAAVCGLDHLYEKQVFAALPETVTFFALYAITAVALSLIFAALVRTANKRAQLRYKVARLAEERRLMSLRDTRLFSELRRMERSLTFSSATSAEKKPKVEPAPFVPTTPPQVEPMPQVEPKPQVEPMPQIEPMPAAPIEEPTPAEPLHARPFAPTPYAEPPKREVEMPEITQPLRKECRAESLCPAPSGALRGISRAKIDDLLNRLCALPLSEGDALAAKKIELSLREAIRLGGSPQEVSSQLSALLKILARYEAA